MLPSFYQRSSIAFLQTFCARSGLCEVMAPIALRARTVLLASKETGPCLVVHGACEAIIPTCDGIAMSDSFYVVRVVGTEVVF